jgi:hypothetical protein
MRISTFPLRYEGISLTMSPKLTDTQAAVEALFSDDIMTQFYTRRGFAGRPLEYLMQAFDEVLNNFAGHGKRALNVLEIGAGERRRDSAFLTPSDVVLKVLAL